MVARALLEHSATTAYKRFDPTTWPADFDGGVRIGEMLGEELADVVERFVEQRVVPAVEWAEQHGGDRRDVILAFAGLVHSFAQRLEDAYG